MAYKIPLMKPYVSQDAKQRVMDVLDSGYLTEGPVTKQLEESFEEYIGVKNALAVCNCTVGLEIALRAVGIGTGDEVIVPDYTYPASASAVAIAGGTPVLVDVDPKTMLIDSEKAEAAITPNTRAIMPVSIFGNPVDYEALDVLKRRHNLLVIEDAACSVGAEYKSKKVGSQADISVFSMHPRKFITTGEGGMVTTNHDGWAAWMDSYKHFGMSSSPTREGTLFSQIGTNYKLSNLQSALGLSQMHDIEMLLSARRERAAYYNELLSEVEEAILPKVTVGGCHSYQSYCVFVPHRDHLLHTLRSRGIEVQIGTYSLHRQTAYQDPLICRIHGDLSGSAWALEHCLTLPLHHEITKEQQREVVHALTQELLAMNCNNFRKIA